MNFIVKKMIPVFFLIFSLLAFGSSNEIIIDDFSNGISPHWKEKKLKGKTEYTIVSGKDVKCLKAESNSSASALYYKIDYDLKKYPILEWKWKIDHVLAKGNAATKEGCDFPARIYVIFHSGFLWQSRSLGYFWASSVQKGEVVRHPYSKNTMMIAVESGNEKAGTWITEKRNVLEDYKKIFGKDPPEAGAIAIITDSDNTGEHAIAWYGAIKITGH